MAHYVEKGAKEVQNAETFLIGLDDKTVDWNLLEKVDAIIFGSPIYNGTVNARFKQSWKIQPVRLLSNRNGATRLRQVLQIREPNMATSSTV
ncbi:hypothetical protein [uncultured Bartonella sp.]|uniref:hypothetical protein n=1 Tax=uncultured Bartonella sp. TaxID=104108 RepID=UPI0025E18AB7|nr:hypothetical protein [uncultured Bartonella sp.]